MTKYDTSTPYIASYLILRRGDRVALLMRSNTKWMDGYYCVPSGKVEKGESFSAAAAREGLEEVGIKINPVNLNFVHSMHRFEPDEEKQWVDIFFEAGSFKGKPYNSEPEIHSELVWLDPEKSDKIVPYIKYALEQIQKGNKFSEYGWSS